MTSYDLEWAVESDGAGSSTGASAAGLWLRSLAVRNPHRTGRFHPPDRVAQPMFSAICWRESRGMDDTSAAVEAIEAVAHSQMGRFTRAQVRELTTHAARVVRTQLRSRRWRRQTTRVLALPGAPRGWLGDLWTAWLHVGSDSVVSHFSAARLHGLPVPSGQPESLTVPAGSHRKHPSVRIHQRSDLGVSDLTVTDGLPLTQPARLLVDLANDVSPARLSAWLDTLSLDRRVTPALVASAVERLGGPGKRGVPALVAVLSDRLPSSGVAQGPLETALAQITVLAGLPAGTAQYQHPGSPTGNEFADRAWPEAQLVVEADGRCFHDRVSTAQNDARRDLAAAAEGWQTIRLRHNDLVGDPSTTARLLRDTYEARLAELSGSALGDSTVEDESQPVTYDRVRLDLGA